MATTASVLVHGPLVCSCRSCEEATRVPSRFGALGSAPAGYVTREAAQHRLAPVVAAVCEVFGITPAHLMSRNRRPEVVIARQVAMWLAVTRFRLSLPSAARALGGWHHTSVLAARRTIHGRLASDEWLRAKVGEIDRRLEVSAA